MHLTPATLLLFAAWLLLLAAGSFGQTCEPWNGIPYGCQGYLGFGPGTPIYVPEGGNLDQITEYMKQYVTALKYGVRYEDCLSPGIAIVCATWLRPCVTLGNETIAYPVEPCFSFCEPLRFTICPQYYPIATYPIPVLGIYLPPGNGFTLTCNETDPDTGNQTFWPRSETTMGLPDGTNVSVPCQEPRNGSIADFGCNYPLISSGLNCAFGCPLPAYTDSQYDSAKVMQNVIAWFSWCGSSVLITSLVLYPPARAFPKVLILLISISANLVAGALILPTFAGYTYTWCGPDDVSIMPELFLEYSFAADGTLIATPNVAFDAVDLITKSSFCTFQGAMLQFGYLASTFLWAIIAFNMTLELFFGTWLHNRERLWKIVRLVVYTVLAWGLSFFLMVIPASAGAIGFGPGDTYCFITEEDNYAWILTFFFIPVGISLLIGITCFAIAIVKIIITTIKLRKFRSLLAYFRLLMFIFIYLFIYAFIFTYVITIAAKQDEIVEGYEGYFGCLLSDGFYVNKDGCSLSDSVSNYNLSMVRGFAICSLGLLLFFTFMTWDLMKHWGTIFRALYLLVVRQQVGPLKKALQSESHISTLTNTVSVAPDTADLDKEEDIVETRGVADSDETDEALEELDEDTSSSSAGS